MSIERPFFCGIGGSGMLPLAMFLKAQGVPVEGSDRAIDQGRADDLRDRLEASGVRLFPQDGSGLRDAGQTLVTSSAVESGIPDLVAARKIGIPHIIRAELLSRLCNNAATSVGVAGTSGKSTTTAMLAWILDQAGLGPGVVNGAPMLNFDDGTGEPAGWCSGNGAFVCEVDESDGSIARYAPSVGVVLNVSEDHKPMDELKALFGGYAERSGHVILGVDSEASRSLISSLPQDKLTTVSIRTEADYTAVLRDADEAGVLAELQTPGGASESLRIPVVGSFNVSNALAAIAAAGRLGVGAVEAASALSTFKGTARRLQVVGKVDGITVIDDFAHNPEKIAASVGALTRQYARLHLFYQPHGYGPLASFRALYEEAFAASLRPSDRIMVSKPAYFGGTTRVTDDAQALVKNLQSSGVDAAYAEERPRFADWAHEAGAGDAVIVMGARDNSLTSFAKALLDHLKARR